MKDSSYEERMKFFQAETRRELLQLASSDDRRLIIETRNNTLPPYEKAEGGAVFQYTCRVLKVAANAVYIMPEGTITLRRIEFDWIVEVRDA